MGARKQKWTSEEKGNVDLKDKWRNMNVFFIESGSMDKGRTAWKKNHHSMAMSPIGPIISDVDDQIVDEQPISISVK